MNSEGQASIRPATCDDVAAIAKMMAEFNDHLAALGGTECHFDSASAVKKLEHDGFGPQPLFSAVIAASGTQPVGYAIYSLGYWADGLEGTVYITDLFVREAWRGRGIGRAIVELLAGVGRDAGCQRMLWTVWRRNPAARRFYESLGARAIEDEVLMTLKL